MVLLVLLVLLVNIDIPGYRRTPSPDIDDVIPGYIDAAILYDNSANGALATVTINKFALPIQDIKMKTELDLSDKGLGVEDATIIAALIPLNVSSTKRFNCCCLLIFLL